MNRGHPDSYFEIGCERGGTPKCNIHTWHEELKLLRSILLECGLNEALKWGSPCYSLENKNIVMLSCFNNACNISFFKGGLLKDAHNILSKPGKNTNFARVIKFTSVDEVIKLKNILKDYIYEAIDVEKSGLKIEPKKVTDDDVPEELKNKLAQDEEFKKAFEVLTVGRQRGYYMYFAAAKQSKTRAARIEKCVPLIMAGKGFLGK